MARADLLPSLGLAQPLGGKILCRCLPQGREEQVDHPDEEHPKESNPCRAKSDDRLIEAMALSQVSSESQAYEGGGEEGEHEEPALVGYGGSAGQLEGDEENQGDQGEYEG